MRKTKGHLIDKRTLWSNQFHLYLVHRKWTRPVFNFITSFLHVSQLSDASTNQFRFRKQNPGVCLGPKPHPAAAVIWGWRARWSPGPHPSQRPAGPLACLPAAFTSGPRPLILSLPLFPTNPPPQPSCTCPRPPPTCPGPVSSPFLCL